VPFRDAIFRALSAYKRVDAAGRHLNNMNGAMVPYAPSRIAGKVEFFRRYKFTLAIENTIWPGYMTEKLVDPMFASSIPIYVGDPQAKLSFDPASYIDFARFSSMKEMLDYVRSVDSDPNLYLKMLAAPFYRGNAIPDYARENNILAFFDRIAEAALVGR
jgi:alpha(1,3/1,4) fucosyltransferase